MKHTPGPWFADGITIESNSGNIGLMNLARPENESKANAAFIVKACNMHEELVEACKEAAGALGSFMLLPGYKAKLTGMTNILYFIEAAIAKAEGKP